MENLIEARVILGSLVLIHAFAGYAAGVYCGHINRKVLNAFMSLELIALTSYIVYDNIQIPPYDGWTLAVIGYIFVYAIILMSYGCYRIYTELEKNTIYEMTILRHVQYKNKDYFLGKVVADNREVVVFLPYSPELDMSNKENKKQKVKFDKVIQGLYIIVSADINSPTHISTI